MRREEGFTLVEILVVMLIIGMLAAIAIPAYLNQKDKASDAEAKASVRTAQTAAETIAIDNRGSYDGPAGVSVPNLLGVEPTLGGTSLTVPFVTRNSYTVRVESSTGNTFDIERHTDGTTAQTCASSGAGGCPDGGIWER